jgi:4-phosphopantoate--beta-alanine ligase
MTADTVLAPLEDGDRTATLRKAGKTVITIDLNPLSRTAQMASITIVDNIVRAMPLIVEESTILKKIDKNNLKDMIKRFDNKVNLDKSLGYIANRLKKIASTRVNSQ